MNADMIITLTQQERDRFAAYCSQEAGNEKLLSIEMEKLVAESPAKDAMYQLIKKKRSIVSAYLIVGMELSKFREEQVIE